MDSMSNDPFSTDALADGGSSQRTNGRDSLFLMAQLALPGDLVVRDVRVRNLSEGGLMLEYARPVKEGTPVVLSLRGLGEITGKVAWNAEGRIGIALDERIDPKLARKPVGGGPGTPHYAKAPKR